MSMAKVNPAPPPPKPGAAAAAAPSPKAATPTDKKSKGKKDESDDEEDTADGPTKEDPAGAAEAAQLKAETDPILKSGAVVKALTVAVSHKGQSVELLRQQAAIALQAMESIKADEIAKFVDSADDLQLDNLMRITYEGMKTGKNCPNLLIWHAKITDKAGIGAIMRAMCGKTLSA